MFREVSSAVADDTSSCTLGGFNVSNLMGITRRKIDIGKKITFYFQQMFQNVQFFSHLHLKYAKSDIITQKKFSLKNIIMGIKKTQNFMLISNSLMPTETNAPKKS
jgi:hypothetical protein